MVFLAPYYALRGWRRGESAQAFRERLGRLSPEIQADAAKSTAAGPIWIHAVSVGEVLAAKPLIDGLKLRFPGRSIFVSTTTETGQRLARERLKNVDGIFYFPIDWVVPVRRSLRIIRPAAVIVMETEIWPNFLREAKREGVPVIFANARISEKSFARFKKCEFLIGPFFAETLEDAALFLPQTSDDAVRLRAMGAPEQRMEILGNLKYDAEPPPINAFAAWLGEEIRKQERWPVIVAGSVVEGEEEAIIAAYDRVQRHWRRTLLILAPRKPNRFDAAAALSAEGGWKVIRRSLINLAQPLDDEADVLLLDSIGDLAGLYSLADATFVGGSLVPSGGHNILEPASFGQPPIFGPSMENFQDMADQFLDGHAGVQVQSAESLAKVWVQLIENQPQRAQIGAAARSIAERNRGAAQRTIERVAPFIDGTSTGISKATRQ
ncbi:MAG TPA: 3-deoxy-D-manno-octulosonic acid transferase [Candidatus Acidoferrales bacterium]